jgi:hypothetical protein
MRNRISVSPGFVLLWTAIYFFDSGGMFLSVAVSGAVHELFHIAALLCVGGRVERMNLRAAGFEIVSGIGLLGYGREFITAAAGPLGSLLLSAAAAGFGRYTLAGTSLTLGLYHLLPVSFLDGGRMLCCAAAMFMGYERAEKAVFVSSMVTLLALATAGLWARRWVFVYFAVILGICCCKIGVNGVKLKDKRTA